MANFIFDWAVTALAAATLDLSTGNYYAHLVTTVPAPGHSTVADLVLPAASGYASTPLTGLSYNSTRWTFDGFSFPKYSFVSAPTGIVICKRTGVLPANTDGIICYSDFTNSIDQNITLQAGDYLINLQFNSKGAIAFDYQYQYSSGAYLNSEPIPKGLIWLVGSQNNTVAFADPNPSKISQRPVGSTSLTSRNNTAGTGGSNFELALDLGSLKIKPNKVGFNNFNPTNVSVNIAIWGSNNLSNNFATYFNNTAFYTPLGSFVVPNWNYIMRIFDVNSDTYWRYFFFQISSTVTLNINQVEFYESSLFSPTLNIV